MAFRADYTGAAQQHVFTNPLFPLWIAMWQDWRNGIPPTSEWRGRGAQNALLMRAFSVIGAAESRAQRESSNARRSAPVT